MSATQPLLARVPADELLRLHGLMVRIRCFELGLRAVFQRMRREAARTSGSRLRAYEYGDPSAGPELQGNLELALGQEPAAAAVMQLRATDYLAGTHRSHHLALAKGVEPRPLVAELLGRASGLCGGRAGDFNLHDRERNFENSPVVGQLLPAAVGHALAARLQARDGVALVALGDGAINQGSFHEAANLAGLWQAPVIFLLENNAYAMSVAAGRSTAIPDRLHTRAEAYGFPGVLVEGNDPLALYEAAAAAIGRARAGDGPTLIELRTDRQAGAFEGDPQHYRPDGEIETLLARDPLGELERALVDAGLLTADAADAVRERERAAFADALELARSSPWPDPAEARRHVFAAPKPAVAADPIEVRTYGEAIGAGIAAEMAADESVVIWGEDIARYGGIYGHLPGLEARFGGARVRDTPISEAGFIGAAAGAAAEGLRPVVELMTVDFFGVAMDQIYNYLAKLRYASGGARSAPLVILASAGNPLRQGVTHSQTLHGTFAHLPGLKVVLPATAEDAAGLVRAAIRDDDPVLLLYHRGLLADGPSGTPALPLGQAAVRRAGSDLTIVAVSFMVVQALRAAERLAERGVDAEVVDLRSLVPLDRETLAASVAKTGRLLVLDEDYGGFGMSGELIAVAHEDCPGAQARRLTRAQTPIPYSRVLEDAVMPGVADIVAAAAALAGGGT